MKNLVDFKKVIFTYLTQKTLLWGLIGLNFLGMVYIVNMGTRPAQQFFLYLFTLMLFGLLLRNIWVTLFLQWTTFLFIYFKFNLGHVYLQNIFIGVMIYYMVKRVFRKEHVKYLINGFLWFVVANLIFIIIQLLGFDPLFKNEEWSGITQSIIWNVKPLGFMHFTAAMGMLMALAVPIMLSRPGWMAKLAGFMLFIPISQSQSSTNVIAAVIGAMFVLFFHLKRKVWLLILSLMIIGGAYYTVKVDPPNQERWPQWKNTFREAVLHPVVGWGLDSFRHNTPDKPYTYVKIGAREKDENGRDKVLLMIWDNPHCLYLSLFYEWGIIGLLLLIGYWRQLFLWFKRAIKTPEIIGIFGLLGVTMLLSVAHFPLFLARLAIIIVMMAAAFEVLAREDRIVL